MESPGELAWALVLRRFLRFFTVFENVIYFTSGIIFKKGSNLVY